MTNITLAITGSISAYKAADITSALGKLGHQVTVLMTDAAQAFITPLTLQVLSKRSVHTNVMAEDKADSVNHIDLAKRDRDFLSRTSFCRYDCSSIARPCDDRLSCCFGFATRCQKSYRTCHEYKYV